MTWGAKITKPSGEEVACWQQCKHYASCYVQKASHAVATVLTSIDVCGDGHMAYGTAALQCGGFEAKEEAQP